MKRHAFATTLLLGLFLATAGMLTSLPAAAANYRLAVEPAYPPEQAAEVYKPLIDYLNRSTGHRFQLSLARDYHAYWRDLRDNAPADFAFDEAHFVDFRIQFHDFTPIARTAEPTVYALIAQPEYEDQGIRALIGHSPAFLQLRAQAEPAAQFLPLLRRYQAALAEFYEPGSQAAAG